MYMVVETKAGLWRVDQVTFHKLLVAHTIHNGGQMKDVLEKVPFLSGLDNKFIHCIANILTTVYYDAGERSLDVTTI